jgi:hypothetical protein
MARFGVVLCPLSDNGFAADALHFAKRLVRIPLNLLILLSSLLALNPIPASAQDLAGLEQGIKPYGAYNGGDIDSISMVNGKLTLHISLISYPRRCGNLHAGFSVGQ